MTSATLTSEFSPISIGTEPTHEKFVVPERGLPIFRGVYGLEGKNHSEITRAIRENFIHGDRIYISMNDKIGDMTQASAFLRAMEHAKKTLNTKTPITLLIPNPQITKLYEPFAKKYGMEIRLGGGVQGVSQADSFSANQGEKNCLVIELNNYGAPETELAKPWVGKHAHNGMVIVGNFFSPVNAYYNNATMGRARYARFTEEFLGLKTGTINPENALPKLPLPENATQIYKELADRIKIDPAKKQVFISLEASTAGRMYDKWEEVIDQLKKDIPDAEINLIFLPNKLAFDPTKINEAQWKTICKKYNGVRMIHGSLQEMSVLLANQSVVIATDSGLSHIAGAIEGGPKVIPLYIPPQTTPEVWETNPDRMFGISAPLNGRDPDSPIGGDLCEDPSKKWVNQIPPQAIAKKAGNLMRSAAEAPQFGLSKDQGVTILFNDILKRLPTVTERGNLITSRKSLTEIAGELRRSPEKLSLDVSMLYRIVLRREPDPEGLDTYRQFLASGKPPGELKKILAGSEENRARIRQLALNNRAHAVQEIYLSVLERPIDSDGKKTYIDNTTIPIDQVLDAVLGSQEYTLGFL